MLNVYLASGWFNEIQTKLMNEIHGVLKQLEIEGLITIFAPYYDGVVVKPGDPRAKWEEAFLLNVEKIYCSDLMIANIEQFDPGTIFETGVAYANGSTPVIAYSSVPGRGLNLMLAQSCIGFANSPKELEHYIRTFITNPGIKTLSKWEGEPI